jgi:hypothetical protein
MLAMAAAVSLAGLPAAVGAQFGVGVAPTSPLLFPPPPAPPPPPRIEVPPVPRLDASPQPPTANSPRHGSFGDRIERCLGEASGRGLGVDDRAAYSSACANRE